MASNSLNMSTIVCRITWLLHLPAWHLLLHMAAIGHPIVGDVMYAIEETTLAKSRRLLLHASELTVAHPASNATMAFRAPCPF